MRTGVLSMIATWSAVSLAGCAFGVSVSPEDEAGSRTVAAGTGVAGGRGAQALDRSRIPPVGDPPALDLPEPADYALDNGLRVVLVERHALPLVSMQLLFRGGASAHPADRAGLAAFTADMLDEGTIGRTALEISEAVDQLGASLTSTAGYDVSTVRLLSLRPRLPEALGLLADVVVRPTFRDADLERVRRERLGRILQRTAQPAALADDAFARALYGPDHPYGAPLLGTEATLSALTGADVRAFHRARYAPGQATLVVVGDVTRDDLDGMLAEAFAGWTGPGQDPPELPDAPEAPTGRSGPGGAAPAIVLVDRPGAAQSEIRVGRVALPRATDRYFPVQVANTVLGGSFTSRLNANLREDKGYTYGAGSYFDLRRRPGPFEASAAVATAATAEAVSEFVKELAGMGAAPVAPAELERARSYLALRLPQRFESVDDVVGRLAELAQYDLPLDFYDGYVEGVMAVDADAVQAVGRAEMDPARMVVVVAGDRAAVEAPLRALGLGPVRTANEEPRP